MEWTDTGSEAGLDVSLHNYKIETNSETKFSDARLWKITNPQMVGKVQQYLSLRSAIYNESENPSSKRRSLMLQAKRNKRNFKRLQDKIQTYIDIQDWYRQAKNDVQIQKSVHSIEYVDVDTRVALPLASQTYIATLAKMIKDERTKMMEKESFCYIFW